MIKYSEMLLSLVTRLMSGERDRSALEEFRQREQEIRKAETRLVVRESESKLVIRHEKEVRELLKEARSLRDSALQVSKRDAARGEFDHLLGLMSVALEGRYSDEGKTNYVPGMNLQELFESYYRPGFYLITHQSYSKRSEKNHEGWRPISEVFSDCSAAFKQFNDRRLEAKERELKCLLAEVPDSQATATCEPTLD